MEAGCTLVTLLVSFQFLLSFLSCAADSSRVEGPSFLLKRAEPPRFSVRCTRQERVTNNFLTFQSLFLLSIPHILPFLLCPSCLHPIFCLSFLIFSLLLLAWFLISSFPTVLPFFPSFNFLISFPHTPCSFHSSLCLTFLPRLLPYFLQISQLLPFLKFFLFLFLAHFLLPLQNPLLSFSFLWLPFPSFLPHFLFFLLPHSFPPSGAITTPSLSYPPNLGPGSVNVPGRR